MLHSFLERRILATLLYDNFYELISIRKVFTFVLTNEKNHR